MLGHRRIILTAALSLAIPTALVAAGSSKTTPRLSAQEVVTRFIAARGGAQAWHAVQTMTWSGQMEAGVGDSVARSRQYVRNSWAMRSGKPSREAVQRATQRGAQQPVEKQVDLPFVLEMKRPNKSRVEIQFGGKTAVQVYDGTNGWKIRPYLNRNDAEPFTAEEAKSQLGKWDLEGPLLDYAAKGSKVEVESIESVEGQDAYKLKLTTKAGLVQHFWIDAQSFLDVKVEGTPRMMDGKMRPVYVYQRDFRHVQNVMIPFVLETSVEGYPETHKMLLEKAAVNPQLDDQLFAKPRA
ncbi:MAG: hypothetical protein JO042_09255 [Sinobacteraceae bacterium]|nr:hypothetical protein [Nevskiaceae bacterium]